MADASINPFGVGQTGLGPFLGQVFAGGKPEESFGGFTPTDFLVAQVISKFAPFLVGGEQPIETVKLPAGVVNLPTAQAIQERKSQVKAQPQAPPQPQSQAQQPQPKSPAGKRSLIDILLRDVLLPGGVGFAAGQQKSAGSRALLQALGSLLAFTLSKQNIEREARRKALEQVGG